MSFLNQPKGPQHWHITAARKPSGECARCDLERAAENRPSETVPSPEHRDRSGTAK
jgi:hypothetical protein